MAKLSRQGMINVLVRSGSLLLAGTMGPGRTGKRLFLRERGVCPPACAGFSLTRRAGVNAGKKKTGLMMARLYGLDCSYQLNRNDIFGLGPFLTLRDNEFYPLSFN